MDRSSFRKMFMGETVKHKMFLIVLCHTYDYCVATLFIMTDLDNNCHVGDLSTGLS